MSTPPPPQSDQILQAVFSVCGSPELAAVAVEAIATVPGAQFLGQFQEYISGERRPQFPETIKNAAGCVALIDCDRDHDLALQTMERLQQTFSHSLSLVAVTSRTDAEFLLRAMRAGCDDVLKMPVDADTLASALRRFQKGHAAAAVAPAGGKILSFYGAKGGVGTTTVAVHLAMYLVGKHRKRVLLIDHKHELGHVALHLGLKESLYFFDELLRNAERLDGDLLDGFVTRHSNGLEVIPSPDTCSPVPEGSPDAIARVLRYLRTRYDFILIDSSLEYQASSSTIMSASDEIAIVSTPDVAALRDLVRRVGHLTAVNGLSSKLRIVVNRATSDDAVSADDIVAAVHHPIAVSIPNNYAGLLLAINSGAPVPLTQRGPFNTALGQWAQRLTNDGAPAITAPEPKKRSLFGFGRKPAAQPATQTT